MHIKSWGYGAFARLLPMLGSLVVAGGCGHPKTTVPFQARVWQENVAARHHMLDDLKANHLVVGMPKESIIQLLGPPHFDLDASEVSRPPTPGAKWYLYYTLDYRELGAFECAYFVVDLSPDKKYMGSSLFTK